MCFVYVTPEETPNVIRLHHATPGQCSEGGRSGVPIPSACPWEGDRKMRALWWCGRVPGHSSKPWAPRVMVRENPKV